MEGLTSLVLALVFTVHLVAFSILGIRRRGHPGAWRYAVLAAAFALLTLAEGGRLAAARDLALLSSDGLAVLRWIARALFALGLGMLAYGLLVRRHRR